MTTRAAVRVATFRQPEFWLSRHTCFLGLLASNLFVAGAFCAESTTTGPSPIRLNTIGYLTDAPKMATVAGPTEDFAIRNAASGEVVLRGKLAAFEQSQQASGQIATADFSEVQTPGRYELVLASG